MPAALRRQSVLWSSGPAVRWTVGCWRRTMRLFRRCWARIGRSGHGFASRSQRNAGGVGQSLANGCIGGRNGWPMELDRDPVEREPVRLELDDCAVPDGRQLVSDRPPSVNQDVVREPVVDSCGKTYQSVQRGCASGCLWPAHALSRVLPFGGTSNGGPVEPISAKPLHLRRGQASCLFSSRC